MVDERAAGSMMRCDGCDPVVAFNAVKQWVDGVVNNSLVDGIGGACSITVLHSRQYTSIMQIADTSYRGTTYCALSCLLVL
jgi:hypothetical protein